jgi:hypothetical protein
VSLADLLVYMGTMTTEFNGPHGVSAVSTPSDARIDVNSLAERFDDARRVEVGAFYCTVPAPGIVNSGREEQGSVSV